MCVPAQSLSCVWLFVTLWTVAHQAPQSMGFSRQEYWSGLPCPSSRGSSWSRDWTCISCVSCIAGEFFTCWAIREAPNMCISSVQWLSCVRLFATPWIAARQASLSVTNSRSSPKLMSIESVMPSSHLILCGPLLLLPSIPPSSRVFSNESTLRMRWPKYWSFSSSISPSNEHPELWSPLEWTGWISLQPKGLSRVFSNTTVQKHQFFGAQLSSQSNSHTCTWPQEKT